MRELDMEKIKTARAFYDFVPKAITGIVKQKRVCVIAFVFICYFLWHEVIPCIIITLLHRWYFLNLFLQMVANRFDCITICMGEIFEFDELCGECAPIEVR